MAPTPQQEQNGWIVSKNELIELFPLLLHVIGVQDHPRPCVSLQKSPFFSDMYMTVGDWNFRLWKVDNETPIFTSPNASTYITVVRTRGHLPHG